MLIEEHQEFMLDGCKCTRHKLDKHIPRKIVMHGKNFARCVYSRVFHTNENELEVEIEMVYGWGMCNAERARKRAKKNCQAKCFIDSCHAVSRDWFYM